MDSKDALVTELFGTDAEVAAKRLAESKARYETQGYVAMTAAEWKAHPKDYKGFNWTTGHAHALKNCGSQGTQLWPVVILEPNGNLARRQPKGRKK